jgi:hypothetical protein
MTMKITAASFLFFAVGFLFAPAAHAQDFVSSSFQCDPLSCEERTPFPVLQATVNVTFDGTCTGGAVGGIESFATAFVGLPDPCPVPFTPIARIEVSTADLLNDFGCIYFVDTVTESAEIRDALGNTVFFKSSGASCDGGLTGPVTFGTKPC